MGVGPLCAAGGRKLWNPCHLKKYDYFGVVQIEKMTKYAAHQYRIWAFFSFCKILKPLSSSTRPKLVVKAPIMKTTLYKKSTFDCFDFSHCTYHSQCDFVLKVSRALFCFSKSIAQFVLSNSRHLLFQHMDFHKTHLLPCGS